MKGIENISGKIIEEANEKAGKILEEANESVKRIKDEAALKTAESVKEINDASKARCNDIVEKARLGAGIEVRKHLAAQKQELIQKAFDDALEQILSLPADEYASLISKLAIDACKDGAGGELVLNKKNREAFGEKALSLANAGIKGQKLTLSDSTANILGGVVIKRGKVEINCALEIIIKMLRSELSKDVADCLFGKGA